MSLPATAVVAWTGWDIGATGRTGSATCAHGVFTVRGAGNDLWGRRDAFHYLYRPLRGDGQIVARVLRVRDTAAWAKAGVTMRTTLTPGSPETTMAVTPRRGGLFQRRVTAGGPTIWTPASRLRVPYWVKLARKGGTVTAYASANGRAWQ